jgi:hypothetical protein
MKTPHMEPSMPFKPLHAVLAAALALAAWPVSAGPVAKSRAAAKSAAVPSAHAAVPSAHATAPAAAAAAPAAVGDSAAAEPTEATKVLLGKSGSRYHLKGCKYLKGGAGKEITIGDAMRKGFAPCNACKAPRVKR